MGNQYRFNRDYQLTVQISADKAVVIRPPMRVVFQVDKSVKASLNKMNIKIYNLSPENREALVKDDSISKNITVELLVGYVGNIQRIFKGSVHIGETTREGSDIVTSLECQDGGHDFRFSYTSKCVTGDPLTAILDDMPNTAKGKITTDRPKNLRSRVLVGNSYKLIGRTLTDQQWFIDDGELHILNGKEVVGKFIPIVQSSTGLINAPTRQKKEVSVQTMMNPSLRCGGLFELNSTLAKHLNKVYKIKAIAYDGDIDGATWQQTITAEEAGEYKVL